MPLLSAPRSTCGGAPAIFGDTAPSLGRPAPIADPSDTSDERERVLVAAAHAGAPWTVASRRADAPDGATALDAWQSLLTTYLGARPVGVSADGEAFPETTTGDVRRIALLLSRELCRPRYDGANLTATRDAWREAVARATSLCAQRAWVDPYPENERFWLSDALALAQRLSAVDVRRNGLITDEHGSPVLMVGDRVAPLTLWGDLRQFFLGRRTLRRSATAGRFRYPDTTVGDVVQVATIFDDATKRTAAFATPRRDLRQRYDAATALWRTASQRVASVAKDRAALEVYPENERFWLRDTKRLATWLSVLREAALPDAATARPPAERA